MLGAKLRHRVVGDAARFFATCPGDVFCGGSGSEMICR
jgi:hypothetical protein